MYPNHPPFHQNMMPPFESSYQTPSDLFSSDNNLKCEECDFIASSFSMYKRHISLHIQVLREKVAEKSIVNSLQFQRDTEEKPSFSNMYMPPNENFMDEKRITNYQFWKNTEERPSFRNMYASPNENFMAEKSIGNYNQFQRDIEERTLFSGRHTPQNENFLDEKNIFNYHHFQKHTEERPQYEKFTSGMQNTPYSTYSTNLHSHRSRPSQYEKFTLANQNTPNNTYHSTLRSQRSQPYLYPSKKNSNFVKKTNKNITVTNKRTTLHRSKFASKPSDKDTKITDKGTTSLFQSNKQRENATKPPDNKQNTSNVDNASALTNKAVCIIKVDGFFCIACKEYLFKDSSQGEKQKLNHAKTPLHLENVKKYKEQYILNEPNKMLIEEH